MKQPLWLLPLLLLAACQPTPTPTAKQYLSTTQKGDIEAAKALRCRSSQNDAIPEALAGIGNWEIVGERAGTVKTDPDSAHTVMLAKIATTGAGGFEVEKTWELTVWDSDEFFEFEKRRLAKFNEQMQKAQNLIEQGDKFGAEVFNTPAPKRDFGEPIVPERSDFSSKPQCVLGVVDTN